MKKLLAILSVVLFANQASANEFCINNMLKDNVCKVAERWADESRGYLPVAVGDGVFITAANANDNVYSLTLKLPYDRTKHELAQMDAGLTADTSRSLYFDSVKGIACDNELTNSFIGMGGHIRYIYRYEDNELLYEFYISSC